MKYEFLEHLTVFGWALVYVVFIVHSVTAIFA
jgi:hypothetical protein